MEKFAYPNTKKQEIVEDYHGEQIKDPYRWLEDARLAETKSWTAQQNEISSHFINSWKEKESIRKILTKLWDYPKYSSVRKRKNRYFYMENKGRQNQAILYMEEEGKNPKIIVDPNELSEDGSATLMHYSVNEDATWIAYSISPKGADLQEVYIQNLDTGEKSPEVLHWTSFSPFLWQGNTGFYYTRNPAPGTVDEKDLYCYKKVYFHHLGTQQEEDILTYEFIEDKEVVVYPIMSDDGNYLMLYLFKGCSLTNLFYYRPIKEKNFIPLLDKDDASYEFIGNVGPHFYFSTNLDANNGRIIQIDVSQEKFSIQTIVEESSHHISNAIIANHSLIVISSKHAQHRLNIYDLQGKWKQEISLPGLGSISELWGKYFEKEFFFQFTSFLKPPQILRYDLEEKELSVFKEGKIDFDSDSYESKQIFYHSKDGTRVPMFILSHKNCRLDGENPTILYGYGGFANSMTPFFKPQILAWLERGGVFAVANLRGGDEYGKKWHKDGMLEKKQNVFDDFASAAEYLIEEKFCSRKKLAIQGRSNGGLLVAASILQRPDLFGAAICQVPVTDMLRYHKFTVGHYWIPEYGDAEKDPEHFRFLYAYSPLHNVEERKKYPPILVTSSDHDDRVVPSHAKKFVATLQEKANKENPILLRIDTNAGHGRGKSTTKLIEEFTDIYSFLEKVFSDSK